MTSVFTRHEKCLGNRASMTVNLCVQIQASESELSGRVAVDAQGHCDIKGEGAHGIISYK